MKSIFYYDTPIGKLGLAESGGSITKILFEGFGAPEGYAVKETALLVKAAAQLNEYFAGKRKSFDLPLAPDGTPFYKSVWNALIKIGYGKTASYKDVAAAVGNVKAVRAVGMANNRNPVPLIIPCHRVIGSDGKLVGYAGGLDVKKYLLDMERRNV